MKQASILSALFFSVVILLVCSQSVLASEPVAAIAAVTAEHVEAVESVSLSSIVDIQKYNRSIHIMAMLLVGFGFLMVFVKKYAKQKQLILSKNRKKSI